MKVDNQAAINFVKSPIENSCLKHIDIKLFLIHELVYSEKFNLVFVRSKANLADVFIKHSPNMMYSDLLKIFLVIENILIFK